MESTKILWQIEIRSISLSPNPIDFPRKNARGPKFCPFQKVLPFFVWGTPNSGECNPQPAKLQTSQLRFQAKWYQNLVVCFLAKPCEPWTIKNTQGIFMGIHIYLAGNYTISPTSNKLLLLKNHDSISPQGGICDRYMQGILTIFNGGT